MLRDETIRRVLQFRDDRDWRQFHTPKDLAISMNLEAAELLEVFQWSGKDVECREKLDKIREISQGEHNVLAIGDGINDALALREADVGIAMGAMGSDLAIESADIALMNNNLLNIPFVVDLARRTRKVIYQNLVLSITISVGMIALSAFGVISALAGSILHNFGAFAVLLNSSRILREEPKE